MDPASNEEASSVTAKSVVNYPGPDPNVKYPLSVLYCGECGLPVDLCDYSPNPEACKNWLAKNHPDFVYRMNNLQINESKPGEATGTAEDAESADKKSSHQKRGGKGMVKSKKEKPPCKIIIQKSQRKGNKYVTVITGLAANDIDLETAKKFFAQKFSCGCSKGDNDELTIQGDVVDSLFNVIPEKYPQITQDMMEEKEK